MASSSSMSSSLSSTNSISTTIFPPITSNPSTIATVSAPIQPALTSAVAMKPATPHAVPVTALNFSPPDNASATLSCPPGFTFLPPPPSSAWNLLVVWPHHNDGFLHRAFEFGSSSNQPPPFPDPNQTMFQSTATAAPFPYPTAHPRLMGPMSNIWSLNLINFVTTTLSSVDDYLSWQFVAFRISHQLMGFVDDSSHAPSPFIIDQYSVQQHNPEYGLWLR